MDFTEKFEQDSNTLIVSIKGELEYTNQERLRIAMLKHLQNGVANIIFDCKKLTYIDSSGIGVFIVCFHEAKKSNGTIIYVDVSDSVFEAFKVTRLDRLFNFYPSLHDALSSL